MPQDNINTPNTKIPQNPPTISNNYSPAIDGEIDKVPNTAPTATVNNYNPETDGEIGKVSSTAPTIAVDDYNPAIDGEISKLSDIAPTVTVNNYNPAIDGEIGKVPNTAPIVPNTIPRVEAWLSLGNDKETYAFGINPDTAPVVASPNFDVSKINKKPNAAQVATTNDNSAVGNKPNTTPKNQPPIATNKDSMVADGNTNTAPIQPNISLPQRDYISRYTNAAVSELSLLGGLAPRLPSKQQGLWVQFDKTNNHYQSLYYRPFTLDQQQTQIGIMGDHFGASLTDVKNTALLDEVNLSQSAKVLGLHAQTSDKYPTQLRLNGYAGKLNTKALDLPTNQYTRFGRPFTFGKLEVLHTFDIANTSITPRFGVNYWQIGDLSYNFAGAAIKTYAQHKVRPTAGLHLNSLAKTKQSTFNPYVDWDYQEGLGASVVSVNNHRFDSKQGDHQTLKAGLKVTSHSTTYPVDSDVWFQKQMGDDIKDSNGAGLSLALRF